MSFELPQDYKNNFPAAKYEGMGPVYGPHPEQRPTPLSKGPKEYRVVNMLSGFFSTLRAIPYTMCGIAFAAWTVTRSIKLVVTAVVLGEIQTKASKNEFTKSVNTAAKSAEFFKKAAISIVAGPAAGVASIVRPQYYYSTFRFFEGTKIISSKEDAAMKGAVARAKPGVMKDLEITATKQKLEAANFDVEAAKNAYDKAEYNVTQAKAAVETAKAAEEKAQAAVADAQKVIDTNGRLAPVTHRFTNTGKKQQEALTAANQSLTAAQQARTAAENAVVSAEKAVVPVEMRYAATIAARGQITAQLHTMIASRV